MQPSSSATAALRRRQRVHDAVRELMAEQGFRVSMDAVASRAGCSKQTLYADFGSKQQLMRSVVQEGLDLTAARLDQPQGDLRETLLGFALEYMLRLTDPSVVTTCQLLSAEASQFPEEAQALYRNGHDAMQQRLAHWLQRAMLRGELKHDQPQCVAELLLGMIIGLDSERQKFAVPYRDDDGKRRRWAEFAIDAFLQMFALPARTSIDRPAASPVLKS